MALSLLPATATTASFSSRQDDFNVSRRPLATTTRDIETVFGTVRNDRAATAALLQRDELFDNSDLFDKEHGIAALLPSCDNSPGCQGCSGCNILQCDARGVRPGAGVAPRAHRTAHSRRAIDGLLALSACGSSAPARSGNLEHHRGERCRRGDAPRSAGSPGFQGGAIHPDAVADKSYKSRASVIANRSSRTTGARAAARPATS